MTCRWCAEECGELMWCSRTCAVLDVDEHVTIEELKRERERILGRLMTLKKAAEEPALVAQVHVLDELVKARGGRPETRATPPGPWRYDCDGQGEFVDDYETIPLELLEKEDPEPDPDPNGDEQ